MYRLMKGDRVGIAACSNPVLPGGLLKLERLEQVLWSMGLVSVRSPYLGEASPKERAAALKTFYADPQIRAIFDISGGDLAGEVLSELDFETICSAPKPMWGYSDLTCILNAVEKETGCEQILYQVRFLTGPCGENMQNAFEDGEALFRFHPRFLRGEQMEGRIAGGNIRCLLKLAGTPWWPVMKGKILFLESMGGSFFRLRSYITQLKQMGVFDEVQGILLGTFTEADQAGDRERLLAFIQEQTGNCPVAETGEIGHAADSKGLKIGGYYTFAKKQDI